MDKKNAHPMLGRTLLSVVPPSLGDLTKLKNPLVLQRDLRPASLITQVQQIDAIPFTLITAVCPFEANGRLSLQKLRGPFNTSVCAASHHLPLSVTPCQCLLFLIKVFFYFNVGLIIGVLICLSRVNFGKTVCY